MEPVEQVAHVRLAAAKVAEGQDVICAAEGRGRGPGPTEPQNPGRPLVRGFPAAAGKEHNNPSILVSNLGSGCEEVISAVRGKRVLLRRSAVHELFLGARAALLEIFCGCMELTLGVRAHGLCAPDGVDQTFPVGDRPWDLSLLDDQQRCREH